MEDKQHIVVPKDFLEHLAETKPNKWKLIVHPEQYIADAIKTLELQLETCRTPARRAKIELRRNSWRKELDAILEMRKNDATKDSEEVQLEDTSTTKETE